MFVVIFKSNQQLMIFMVMFMMIFYGNDPPGIKHGNYSIGNPQTFQGADLARETT